MKTGTKIIIIISSLSVIGGCVGAYFYFKNKKKNKVLVSGNDKMKILQKLDKPIKQTMNIGISKEAMKK